MNRRYFICFIILLVLIFLMLGNYIYNIDSNSYINLINRSIKEERSKFTIFVEVDKKRLSLIDRESDNILRTYTIATGKPSSPTPLGSFTIVHKARWGEGFGSRWMGLDVPWGNYGIHGTNQPGSIGGNVSAGCVRMRNSDIEELYDLVPENTSVLIINGDYGAFGHGYRTLKPGDRGADVFEVQKRLSQRGYYDYSIDGIYGENMKAGLIKFLKDNNIPLTDKITHDIYEKLGIILMD
ncbi:MAG: L,D-transpeptidase family protein [Tissierellaceae bacterium]